MKNLLLALSLIMAPPLAAVEVAQKERTLILHDHAGTCRAFVWRQRDSISLFIGGQPSDNQTLIVPNSQIWGNVIKNVTAQTKRRVDLVFSVGYGEDIVKTEGVLKQILDDHEKVLDDPEPLIKVHELGDSSVNFAVRPWVNTEDYWSVYWDITRSVKLEFDEAGISIPFPQRDVHFYRDGNAE